LHFDIFTAVRNKKRTLIDLFIYALPQITSIGMNLITLPLLTRKLSPEEFGVVVLAGLIPTLVVNFLTLSIVGATQRNYFEHKGDRKKLSALLIGTQLFLLTIFLLALAPMYFFKNQISFISLGNDRYGLAVFVSFLSLFLNQFLNLYLLIYQAMGNSKIFSAISIVQGILTAVLSVIFVFYFELSYLGPILGGLCGSLFPMIFLVFYFNKNMVFYLSLKILKENIYYGIQLAPRAIPSFINKFFDKYLINQLLSLSAVGIYNIGVTFGNLLIRVENTIWNAFYANVYNLVFEKKKKKKKEIGRIFTVFSYLALWPLILATLFAKEIVILLAPPTYYQAIPVMYVMCVAMAANIMGIFVGIHFAYSNKPFLLTPIAFFSNLSTVLFNLFLIPRFGILGAALATLMTYGISNMAYLYVGQKIFHIAYEWSHLFYLYATITVASLIMLIFYIYPLQNFILIYGLKAGFIAFFAMLGFKVKIVTLQKMNGWISNIKYFKTSI